MSTFKRGNVWWYKFRFQGELHQHSSNGSNKKIAEQMETKHKERLQQGFAGLEETPKQYRKTLAEILVTQVEAYNARHATGQWTTKYAAKHLTRHLGENFIPAIDQNAVLNYQTLRLKENASKAYVDAECGVLFRAMGDAGVLLRNKLRKMKAFPLNKNPEMIGKPYTILEQDRLFKAAAEAKTPLIYFALTLALNGAMRDGEIRGLKWSQIDFRANTLTIYKSKNRGSQRVLPLNGILASAFFKHREWFIAEFKEYKPEWYVFPSGRPGRRDATKPVEGFESQWTAIKQVANVEGRWHDHRHTVCSQLAESGASEQTIISIMGHVSPQMLKRYCHVGIEAKREALDAMTAWIARKRELEIAAQQQLAAQLTEQQISATIN